MLGEQLGIVQIHAVFLVEQLLISLLYFLHSEQLLVNPLYFLQITFLPLCSFFLSPFLNNRIISCLHHSDLLPLLLERHMILLARMVHSVNTVTYHFFNGLRLLSSVKPWCSHRNIRFKSDESSFQPSRYS